jgi:alanine racemase
MPTAEQAGAILEIDLGSLVDNFRRLNDLCQGAECSALMKADAYGLGAPEVARALAAGGCETFFVAHLHEGMALRAHLPDRRIFVLHGPMPATESDFNEHRLIPVLNSREQIDLWGRHARAAGGLAAALHVDTGLNRLGLSATDVDAIADDPDLLAGVEIGLVLSHLACAEETEHPLNPAQRQSFERLRARLPAAPASLANSSGIFLGPEYHYDLVRPGVALYGVNPLPGQPNPMRQVVTLKGKILQVREIDRDEAVGYGAVYRAPGPRTIATVPVGYADGFLRSLGNKGMGVIAGVPVPMVGRISMDLITFDVTDAPAEATHPGALIELIGPDMPLSRVAELAGTIEYEILTALSARYHRRFVNAPGATA